MRSTVPMAAALCDLPAPRDVTVLAPGDLTLDLRDLPAIESVLINRTDVEASGSGETSITVVAAAIGNAIFDATGARIRQVPFTAERVKAALDART